MKRRAKIVATIGPASYPPNILRDLLSAGVDVARLNMSHGSYEEHRTAHTHLRKISQELGKSLAILLDLQGPKIRTGAIAGERKIELSAGARVRLTDQESETSPQQIYINYPHLSRDLSVGDRLLLDDGKIELKVRAKSRHEIEAEVINGGELASHKGVNIPEIPLSIPAITEKDHQDLAFGIELGVDAVALSFVRRADDVSELQQAINRLRPQCEHIPVIAKLERPEAVEHLEEILDCADGVMVARGDLGVEVSAEKVPSLQKEIIRQANMKRKLVITATQMLESMIHNPRPTRAESSDVANAVFDGSDAVMLSGETAVGEFPIQSVQTMERIILDAEAHASQWGLQLHKNALGVMDDAVATTLAAKGLAEDRKVKAISVFTRSGRTACYMANARPRVPILAFTPEEHTFRQMALLWGVEPHLVPMASSVEQMIDHVEQALRAGEKVSRGQQVVLVASLPIGAMGPANFTLLHTIL
jgi:pyruvate kinase